MIQSRILNTIFISALIITTSCSTSDNPDTPKMTTGNMSRDVSYVSTPLTDEFDSVISEFLSETDVIPGMSIAVVKNDKVVYLKSFGFADIETKLEVNQDTKFYIASSFKSFTALTMLLLAEKGLIDLEAPISKYLTTLKFSSALSAESVSVKDLLTHNLGFENDPITFRTSYSGEHDNTTLINILKESSPTEKQFSYDNLGYVMSGIIIENVTGKPWKQVVREEVLDPLNMINTTSDMNKVTGGSYAKPHGWMGDTKKLSFMKKNNVMNAAGGHYTTAKDMINWLKVNLNGGTLNGKRIFPEELMAKAHKSQIDLDRDFYKFHRYGYGFGWYISNYDEELLIHHFGSYTGYRAHVSFMPEHNIGIVIFVNDLSPVGVYIPDILAAYVYDRMLEKPEAISRISEEKAGLIKKKMMFSERVEQMLAQMASRKFNLTCESETYQGTFRNESFGTLDLSYDHGLITASIGNLSAELTPFKKQNSMRVELVPNRGRVIDFYPSGTCSEIDSLKYMGAVWLPVN